MVAGHLQEKNGYYYMVLTYKDELGKRKTKWISTGLCIKGNKKKAEQMLVLTRKDFDPLTPITEESDELLFSNYMISWLEILKPSVEITTYAAYKNNIHKIIVPYFKERNITLVGIQPKHIQEFYTDQLKRGINEKTVIRYHANIRKALQYAVKTDLLTTNPADKVQRPKQKKFSSGFYGREEINQLLEIIKGERIEIGVQLAAFYGLRRGEIVGLKWSAINFTNKTITIQHTVTEANLDGKLVRVSKDRAKNKSSLRTLPLVPKFEKLLLELKEIQHMNRRQNGNSYSKEFLEYVYVNELGELIKPNFLTQNFQITLKNNEMRKIRFHDLRHSCASLLLANGVSMKEIQDWLGHSDFATTANIYSHLDFNSKVASANVMASVLDIK